jgi:acyl-coenzyme A thioesterase PaaI-like protein
MANITQVLFQKLSANGVRRLLNLWPPLWGAGISIKKISPDYRDISVVMKLHWYNKNYMGTHFGGSLYSMTDPFPMLMVISNLGNGYIVWDKAARIDFVKPGRGTVYANFHFSAEEIVEIKRQADSHDKYLFDKSLDVIDDKNEIIATIVKTIYVRKIVAPIPESSL